MHQRPYTAVLIVPTGVGAAIGGYAGDAIPVARALALACDRLITHPNVLNGAQLYWHAPNISYVEGYALDKFAGSCWGLRGVCKNKVGLILDRGIEKELQLRHLQATDAARATLGLDIADYIVTDAALEVELRQAKSGASWGTIGNTGSLLRAAEKLIDQFQVEAIAIVARFPDDTDSDVLQDYRQGKGVDHLAGAEAVISHLIVRNFQIPAAHAPALQPLPPDPNLSPRAAAEELGYTFLPCVLVGLSRAPQYIINNHNYTPIPGDIWAEQVDVVIIPASACGGSAILSFSSKKAKIIAVTENKTQMQVFPESLGIKAIRVNSYLEALGILVADRAGISADALRPSITSLSSITSG